MSPVETAKRGLTRLMLEEHIVHALVVIMIVASASILRFADRLDNNTVSIVFGTGIGYAAGRSGTIRASQGRRNDSP